MSKPKKPVIAGTSRVVDIDTVRPNPWNPNRQSDFRYDKELASIREYGFVDPPTVRSGRPGEPFDGWVELIDGEHRWRAAKELGFKRIPVIDLGEMTDARARVLTDLLNNLRGENDRQKWATMIRSALADEPGLVSLLPYPQAEIDDMLRSVEFDWNNLDDGDPDPRGDPDSVKLVFVLTEAQAAAVSRALARAKPGKKTDDATALVTVCRAFKPARARKAKPRSKD